MYMHIYVVILLAKVVKVSTVAKVFKADRAKRFNPPQRKSHCRTEHRLLHRPSVGEERCCLPLRGVRVVRCGPPGRFLSSIITHTLEDVGNVIRTDCHHPLRSNRCCRSATTTTTTTTTTSSSSTTHVRSTRSPASIRAAVRVGDHPGCCVIVLLYVELKDDTCDYDESSECETARQNK